MKKNIKRLCMLLPLAATLLLPTGCKKDITDIQFLGIAEDAATDPDAKTHLWNETHVYWDYDDAINVRYMDRNGTAKAMFRQTGTVDGSEVKAIFQITSGEVKVPEDGTGYYMALFPYHEDNHMGEDGKAPVINFPTDQGYKDDNSFGKAACPMVAYGNLKDGNNLVRLLFHNLAGLVRIQIMDSVDNPSSSDAVHTLKSLTFTTTPKSENKQLSGPFEVQNYDQNAPSLKATAPSKNSVTITLPNGGIDLPVHNNRGNSEMDKEPLTFYLALPAISGTGDNNYQIAMTVTAETKGKGTEYVSKAFNVKIRRNGITKMRTLVMREWATSADESGEVSQGLAGNGTEARPFLIYSEADLVKLREACNHSTKINGKSIINGVHIRIMKALTLNTSNWEEGIRDFQATMTYGASQSSAAQGITMNTNVPLFESIGVKGKVKGLPVKGVQTWSTNTSDAKGFSPLCYENKGTISDCMVDDAARFSYINYGSSQNVGVGGICVENSSTGIIQRCGCRGHLQGPKVGGICLNNHGTIRECFIPSPMRAFVGEEVADSVGGIVFCNEGTVSDCYFAANINLSTAHWAGIAFQNKTSGKISHCYVDQSGIIQSNNSVGGIVHTLLGGTINNCWNDADLMLVESNGGLGGIVYNMKGGTVINSYRRRPSGSMTCKAGVMGGMVARMSGGTVQNSYVYSDMSQSTCTTKGIFVGDFTGGTIENCYGEQWKITGGAENFFGATSGSVTLNHCYGQSAQTGITVYASYDELLNGKRDEDQNVLFPGLKYHASPWPDGWLEWEAGPTNEPARHKQPASSKRR